MDWADKKPTDPWERLITMRKNYILSSYDVMRTVWHLATFFHCQHRQKTWKKLELVLTVYGTYIAHRVDISTALVIILLL